jgi:hypothetical protein
MDVRTFVPLTLLGPLLERRARRAKRMHMRVRGLGASVTSSSCRFRDRRMDICGFLLPQIRSYGRLFALPCDLSRFLYPSHFCCHLDTGGDTGVRYVLTPLLMRAGYVSTLPGAPPLFCHPS